MPRWGESKLRRPRLPTEFDVRTDDELSLAEKVAMFPQHKRDQIFAGYTQADFASLSSIHDRADMAGACHLQTLPPIPMPWRVGSNMACLGRASNGSMIRAAALRARSDDGRAAAGCLVRRSGLMPRAVSARQRFRGAMARSDLPSAKSIVTAACDRLRIPPTCNA